MRDMIFSVAIGEKLEKGLWIIKPFSISLLLIIYIYLELQYINTLVLNVLFSGVARSFSISQNEDAENWGAA